MAGKLVLIVVAVCFIGLAQSVDPDEFKWSMDYFKLTDTQRKGPGNIKSLLQDLVDSKSKSKVPAFRYNNANSLLDMSKFTEEKCNLKSLGRIEQQYNAYKKYQSLALYLRACFLDQFRFCVENVWASKELEDEQLRDQITLWDVQIHEEDLFEE